MPRRRPRGCDEILRKRPTYAPISVDPVTMGHQIERRHKESAKTKPPTPNGIAQSPKKQKISLEPAPLKFTNGSDVKNHAIHWTDPKKTVVQSKAFLRATLHSVTYTNFQPRLSEIVIFPKFIPKGNFKSYINTSKWHYLNVPEIIPAMIPVGRCTKSMLCESKPYQIFWGGVGMISTNAPRGPFGPVDRSRPITNAYFNKLFSLIPCSVATNRQGKFRISYQNFFPGFSRRN